MLEKCDRPLALARDVPIRPPSMQPLHFTQRLNRSLPLPGRRRRPRRLGSCLCGQFFRFDFPSMEKAEQRYPWIAG